MPWQSDSRRVPVCLFLQTPILQGSDQFGKPVQQCIQMFCQYRLLDQNILANMGRPVLSLRFFINDKPLHLVDQLP